MIQSGYKKLRRLSDVVALLLEIISTLALMFIVFSFGWLVFGRYALNSTPTWVEHTTMLLVSMITFMMMAANQRLGKNLAISIATDRMPAALRLIVLLVADAVVIAFGILMAIYGSRLVAFNASQSIPMLGISEGWRMVPFVIGGSILAFFSLLDAMGRLIAPETLDTTTDDVVGLDTSKLDIGGR